MLLKEEDSSLNSQSLPARFLLKIEGEGSWGPGEKKLENAYKVGGKITMSREPAY
jgi:hypothetical protein